MQTIPFPSFIDSSSHQAATSGDCRWTQSHGPPELALMRLSASGSSQLKRYNVRLQSPLTIHPQPRGPSRLFTWPRRVNGVNDVSNHEASNRVIINTGSTAQRETAARLLVRWSVCTFARLSQESKQARLTPDVHTRQRLNNSRSASTPPKSLINHPHAIHTPKPPNNSNHRPLKISRTSFTIHKSHSPLGYPTRSVDRQGMFSGCSTSASARYTLPTHQIITALCHAHAHAQALALLQIINPASRACPILLMRPMLTLFWLTKPTDS